MPEINAARRARARDQVAALGADAALITSRANVRYLTGLASSNAALLLPADGPEVLATDSRYAEAAARDCPDVELVIDRFIEEALATVACSRGLRTVAFEAQEMTVERHQALAGLDGGPALIPFGRVIEELRVVKDEAEIELLARACAITSEACAEALEAIRPGLTEREFAVLLERRMIDHGAEALAFDTIVASGPNGAIPHHVPGTRPFAAGDLITIDCGARYAGYHADMTRTVALGTPAAWQRDIYALVAAAQQAGIQAARPGTDVSAVDAAARDLIAEPATASISSTGSATVSASRSMRLRSSGTEGPVHSGTGLPLPSSPGSTCRARAASGSRTPWWSVTAPGRRDRLTCSPRPRGNCSSFRRRAVPARTRRDDRRGHHE